jgi:hypothetical protein
LYNLGMGVKYPVLGVDKYGQEKKKYDYSGFHELPEFLVMGIRTNKMKH